MVCFPREANIIQDFRFASKQTTYCAVHEAVHGQQETFSSLNQPKIYQFSSGG